MGSGPGKEKNSESSARMEQGQGVAQSEAGEGSRQRITGEFVGLAKKLKTQ